MISRARRLAAVAAAGAAFVAGAHKARTGSVGPLEARCFARVNDRSPRAFVPVWAVMQLGSLPGSVATGLAVAAAGRRRLGRRLAATAGIAWVAAKAVKPLVGRGRPTTIVPTARVLGNEQAGLGYPSGHAAVATALAAAVAPSVPRAARCGVWAGVASVGLARLYVGAHLPLDVLGGTALGLAIGTLAAPDPDAAPPGHAGPSQEAAERPPRGRG